MSTSAAPVSPAKVFARSTDGAAWLGPKQRAAIAYLRGRTPVRLLLGPSSSGKSTILCQFTKQQPIDVVTLPVSGPKLTARDVLSTLLTGVGLSLWTLSENEQRNLLMVFIEQRAAQGRHVAICVDDVSGFSEEAWSEIDRLCELRFAGLPIVELVVAATHKEASHAPLHHVLKAGRRFGADAMHRLAAPDGRDLEQYIRWRLARFGIKSTFTAEACAAIARNARGRFNSINMICQVLLWSLSVEQPETIDEKAVSVAMSKLAALKHPESLLQTQKLARLELDGEQVEHEDMDSTPDDGASTDVLPTLDIDSDKARRSRASKTFAGRVARAGGD